MPFTPPFNPPGFCYILKVPVQSEGVASSILYVWVGSKSTEELMNAAVEIGSESFEVNWT